MFLKEKTHFLYKLKNKIIETGRHDYLVQNKNGVKGVVKLHISDVRCMLIDFGIWLDKNDVVLENGNITENVDKFIKSINYI